MYKITFTDFFDGQQNIAKENNTNVVYISFKANSKIYLTSYNLNVGKPFHYFQIDFDNDFNNVRIQFVNGLLYVSGMKTIMQAMMAKYNLYNSNDPSVYPLSENGYQWTETTQNIVEISITVESIDVGNGAETIFTDSDPGSMTFQEGLQYENDIVYSDSFYEVLWIENRTEKYFPFEDKPCSRSSNNIFTYELQPYTEPTNNTTEVPKWVKYLPDREMLYVDARNITDGK